MHYFGAMTDWKKLNSFSLSLLAGICLIAAWTWSPLVVLLFPAWVMLLELAGRKKRPLLFLYLAFAIWNGGTTYWIANAHPLGVIATVGINAWLMAFALWFGISGPSDVHPSWASVCICLVARHCLLDGF